MKTTTEYTVTAENIDKESYYNLLQLVKITGYATPDKALKVTGEEIKVIKDDLGNILRFQSIAINAGSKALV